MPDDFYFEWNAKVREVYRTVVAECDPDEGVKLDEAKGVAAERIRSLVATGELRIPVDFAIRSALAKADENDGKIADRVIARMIRGEDALDFEDDPALDCVVVLGDGLRKPLRYVKREDLLAMDSLRYKNMRAQIAAYDEWRETYERALSAVIKHGTFGAAVESGEFA